MATLTLFRPGSTDAHVIPLDHAASAWGRGDTMRGMAVSAVLARSAHAHVLGVDDGWLPARWSVDFGRPAAMEESHLVARTVRQGRRLLLVDVAMEQGDGRIVAWGRGAFVRPSVAATGRVWEPAPWATAPAAGMLPSAARLYWSEAAGWSDDPGGHQGATRKGLWQRPFTVVESEPTHPFPFVAAVADIASVATQWGEQGVQHINLDLSLHLSRLPDKTPEGVGIVAIHRAAHGGQAVGTAELYDAQGSIGTAAVTAIQNQSQAAPDQLRSVHPRHREAQHS